MSEKKIDKISNTRQKYEPTSSARYFSYLFCLSTAVYVYINNTNYCLKIFYCFI